MYPYNFEPSIKGLNPDEIFVVMPFDKKYEAVFNVLIQKAVSQVSAKRSITLAPFRSDQDPRTVSGWTQILEHLSRLRSFSEFLRRKRMRMSFTNWGLLMLHSHYRDRY